MPSQPASSAPADSDPPLEDWAGPAETSARPSQPAAPSQPSPAAPPSKPSPKTPEPGQVLWQFPEYLPGQGPRPVPLRGCPAVDDHGRLLAAIGQELFSIRLGERGPQIEWKKPVGGVIPGSPAIGEDRIVRVHAGDGRLYGFSLDGTESFATEVGEPLGWAHPLVDRAGHAYVSAYNGGVLKVEPGATPTGPFFRSRQKFDSTGILVGDQLILGAEDAFVYSIRLEGKRGKNTWGHLAGQGKTGWFINSAIALSSQQSVIVAGRDEYLYSFALDGSPQWKVHLRGQMLASPVIDAAGDVYVGVSLERRGGRAQGRLVCVGGDSHRLRWEVEAQGPIESTPVIGDDGVIYFGDNAGYVHAVGEDGGRRWSTHVGAPVRGAGTIPAEHRVLFGADQGKLVALHCSSRKLGSGWPKFLRDHWQTGLAD